MEHINGIVGCLNSMNKISKNIIKFIMILVFCLYFFAFISISCAIEFYPDVDTAFYWFEQFTNAGKEILGGGIIPVFIFEFLTMNHKLNDLNR